LIYGIDQDVERLPMGVEGERGDEDEDDDEDVDDDEDEHFISGVSRGRGRSRSRAPARSMGFSAAPSSVDFAGGGAGRVKIT